MLSLIWRLHLSPPHVANLGVAPVTTSDVVTNLEVAPVAALDVAANLEVTPAANLDVTQTVLNDLQISVPLTWKGSECFYKTEFSRVNPTGYIMYRLGSDRKNKGRITYQQVIEE
ncbi:hypothetical protein BGZ49_009357 [Haplosporangium sp. Z 27]|nr:hypothetical protein BGZ49_009357 [Haplosporangium sp. Z 27]